MAGDRFGTGSGKLLLFGEHAAVYGHPACGLTLPLSIELTITPVSENDWRLPSMQPAEVILLERFLQETVELLPADCRSPGQIRIDSDIPVGMGFGSSAAWCVAFVRAMIGATIPVDQLWEIAHRAERFFHGTPSGIDTGLALLDGLYAFAPDPPALPATRRLAGFPLHFVVGSVPRSGSTRQLVGDLRKRIEAGETIVRRGIDRLGALSAEAIEVLSPEEGSPNPSELGRMADSAHHLLDELGLSTEEINMLLEVGRKRGACGGKLSGAGGGGAFFLLFPDAENADRALPELRAAAKREGLDGAALLFRFSWPATGPTGSP